MLNAYLWSVLGESMSPLPQCLAHSYTLYMLAIWRRELYNNIEWITGLQIYNTAQKCKITERTRGPTFFWRGVMGFELDWVKPAGQFCHGFIMMKMVPFHIGLQSRINSPVITNCFVFDIWQHVPISLWEFFFCCCLFLNLITSNVKGNSVGTLFVYYFFFFRPQ